MKKTDAVYLIVIVELSDLISSDLWTNFPPYKII